MTRTDGGVRVATAVLSANESASAYGVPLASRSIQPVWIEVENRENSAYYLLSPGLDPNFFPASEASELLAADAPSARARRTRPALSRACVPQSRSAGCHALGIRPDQPR